jgi:predicted nucleic-acid-binding protein
MKEGNADFSDYLIGKINQQTGCTETASFDAKLRDTEGFRLL